MAPRRLTCTFLVLVAGCASVVDVLQDQRDATSIGADAQPPTEAGPHEDAPQQAGPRQEIECGPVRWDDSLDDGLTLSDDGLQVTRTSAGSSMGARGTTSHTRGRWYFEATVLGGDDDASSIGIAGELGDVKAACSVDLAGGTSCSFSTGTGSSGGGAPPPDDGVHARVGDVIGVAVDLDEREIRYTLNGATFGQPFLMVSETSGLPMRPRARMPLEHGFRGEFSMFQHPQEGYLPWQCSP